jgi:xyloglucan O-acetyltransferase
VTSKAGTVAVLVSDSEQTSMAPLLPTTPSSSTTTASPRFLLHSNSSSEWSVVVQRNVKSWILLLLVLSTVFAFSAVHSSRRFGTAATTGEAIGQRPLGTDHDATHLAPGGEQADVHIVPGDNYNVAEEKSAAAGISLPSANNPVVPTPSASVQNDDQSKYIP